MTKDPQGSPSLPGGGLAGAEPVSTSGRSLAWQPSEVSLGKSGSGQGSALADCASAGVANIRASAIHTANSNKKSPHGASFRLAFPYPEEYLHPPLFRGWTHDRHVPMYHASMPYCCRTVDRLTRSPRGHETRLPRTHRGNGQEGTRGAGPGCSQSKRPGPAREKTREGPEGGWARSRCCRHPNADGRDPASAQRHIFYEARQGGQHFLMQPYPACNRAGAATVAQYREAASGLLSPLQGPEAASFERNTQGPSRHRAPPPHVQRVKLRWRVRRAASAHSDAKRPGARGRGVPAR